MAPENNKISFDLGKSRPNRLNPRTKQNKTKHGRDTTGQPACIITTNPFGTARAKC